MHAPVRKGLSVFLHESTMVCAIQDGAYWERPQHHKEVNNNILSVLLCDSQDIPIILTFTIIIDLHQRTVTARTLAEDTIRRLQA